MVIVQRRDLEKVYVARVLGVFPEEPVDVDVALAWDPKTNNVTAMPGGPKIAEAGDVEAAQSGRHSTKRRYRAAGKADRGDDKSGGSSKRQCQSADSASAMASSEEGGQPAAASQQPGSAQPKAAYTAFKRLAVAPDRCTSMVECRLENVSS